jgi:hypothetical protein
MVTNAKQRRIAAGKSQEWCGVMAGTSAQTVRLYEIDAAQIRDRRKVIALDAVYQALGDPAAAAEAPRG